VKVYAIFIAIGIAIGASAAWWIQGVRIGHLEMAVETLTTQLKDCQDANVTDQATIGEMIAEARSAAGMCDNRLKTKEGLVKRLEEIDNLKPRAIKNEKGNPADAADPLLSELNGMFSVNRTGAADRKN
jgi:hypothetical protein